MPRGTNYVNNNKGVSLQASRKKKHATSVKMVACQYGRGCTRSDCIYSHPPKTQADIDNHYQVDPSFVQSKEPCMAYLADMCSFSAKGCRKRHPPKDEKERLIAKYQQMNCRYGDMCQTRGCLYLHPSDICQDAYVGSTYVHQKPDEQYPLPQSYYPQEYAYSSNNNNSQDIYDQQQYQVEYQNDYQKEYYQQYDNMQSTGGEIDETIESNKMQGINVHAIEFVPGWGGNSASQPQQRKVDEGKYSYNTAENTATDNASLTSSVNGTNSNAREFIPGRGWV